MGKQLKQKRLVRKNSKNKSKTKKRIKLNYEILKSLKEKMSCV